MKINWGVGLVIGMIAFITFIMIMVVTMMTNKEYDHDMVTEGYYEKELHYQDEIDAESNAQKLSSPISVEKTNEGWLFHFPEEMTNSPIEGTVELYRPSNKKLDFVLPLEIQEGTMLIPAEKLLEGQWKVTMYWQMNGEPFLFKKQMQY